MKDIKNEAELREMIKELLMKDGKISEHDVLFSKEDTWERESRKLKSDLVDMLKHIEVDEYKEGVNKINGVITILKHWKKKIEKRLD